MNIFAGAKAANKRQKCVKAVRKMLVKLRIGRGLRTFEITSAIVHDSRPSRAMG